MRPPRFIHAAQISAASVPSWIVFGQAGSLTADGMVIHDAKRQTIPVMKSSSTS
jgi:hypothetical protein